MTNWYKPTNALPSDGHLLALNLRCTLAEQEFAKERLLEICNLVSVLFLAEMHYSFELLIEEFVKLFHSEADKQAVSLLVNWFRQLVVHGRVRSEDYVTLEREYHSAQEVREMLIDALASFCCERRAANQVTVTLLAWNQQPTLG